MIIPAGTKRTGRPVVTIRKPGRRQLPIAFSAMLKNSVLRDATHVGLMIDPEKRLIAFYPCKEMFRGEKAHHLIKDGAADGKLFYLPILCPEFLNVAPGRYNATITKTRFTIRYTPKGST